MAKTHVAEQCDHLPGIAATHGFSDFRTIWDHPENAELKKTRKNPNILLKGDRVFVPDRDLRQEARPTDARHRFVVSREPLHLRVKVLDLMETPQPPPCFLVVDLIPDLMGHNDGVFQASIATTVKTAELQFPEARPRLAVPLAVGCLDPIDTTSGQRERLNNLGYFAGFAEQSVDQFVWAVEEFQADHLKEIGLARPTGVCDARTQRVLQRVYGA